LAQKHSLEYILGGIELVYAEPEDASTDNGASLLMEHLIQFPAAAERLTQRGTSLGNQDGPMVNKAEDEEHPFAYEHPSLLSYEALEPTSGRKRWMIKHGKRIKKKLKADKRGYIGGS